MFTDTSTLFILHGVETTDSMWQPDLLVPDFTQANWGSNYPRLLPIKKVIDPDNMFLVVQDMNSENWDLEQIYTL